MSLRVLLALVLLSAVFATSPVRAAAAEGGNPDAVSHAADAYYLDFLPVGKLELPRILLVQRRDGGLGLDVFSSTHSALESGRYGLLSRDGAPLTPEEVDEVIAEHKHVYFPLVPLSGSVVVDFSISRNLVFVFIAAILLLLVAFRLAARYRRGIGVETAPRGLWHNFMEVLIVFVRDEICRPTLGAKTGKYFPYLLTAFLFIMIANLMGLVPWGVTATSGIAVTAALASFTFVITQIAGTKDYWRHIFNPPGVPGFTKVILVPIELVGMFTKPLALAFRLFGNMVSGHLVIVSLLGLIFIFTSQFGTGMGVASIFISVPLTLFIYVLKLAVALIQAYVFTILSAVFIGLALEEHEHVEHGHGDGHELDSGSGTSALRTPGVAHEHEDDGTLRPIAVRAS